MVDEGEPLLLAERLGEEVAEQGPRVLRHSEAVRVEVLVQLGALLAHNDVDRRLQAVDRFGGVVLEPQLTPVGDEG